MHKTNQRSGNAVRDKVPVIALRLSDDELYKRLNNLAKEQKISLNMTVNMLLGFAFNEVEKHNKTFVPKVVFESK